MSKVARFAVCVAAILAPTLLGYGCAARIRDPNTGKYIRVSSSTDHKTDQGPEWWPRYDPYYGQLLCQTKDTGETRCVLANR